MALAPMPASGRSSAVRGTMSPRLIHTGGAPAAAAADFNNSTPVATETYMAEIYVPSQVHVKGVAVFMGSVNSDNIKVAILDPEGTVLGSTASTAGNTTADNYQSIPLSTAIDLVAGTYYVAVQIDSNTTRLNTHVVGSFGGGKQTSTVYGTVTGLTPPVTFTTALAPVASLY